MSTRSFFGGDVMNIRLCDAQAAGCGGPATGALAAGFDGGEVSGVGCVAEVEGSGGGDGVAEALDNSKNGAFLLRMRV